MSKKTKEYVESTIITFLTGFIVVLATEIDTLTLDSFQDGALIGVIFAATRFGLKAVFQEFLKSRG